MIFFGGFPPAGGLLPGARCQLVTGLSFSGNRLSLLVTRVADSMRQVSYHFKAANTPEGVSGRSLRRAPVLDEHTHAKHSSTSRMFQMKFIVLRTTTSGEAELFGGDILFLILFSDERAVHRSCPLRKRQSGFL